MPESQKDDWVTVPEAARRLGLALHTAYDLDRAQLAAEVTVPTNRLKRRRSVRVRAGDVEAYVERAQVNPGELRHLIVPATRPV